MYSQRIFVVPILWKKYGPKWLSWSFLHYCTWSHGLWSVDAHGNSLNTFMITMKHVWLCGGPFQDLDPYHWHYLQMYHNLLTKRLKTIFKTYFLAFLLSLGTKSVFCLSYFQRKNCARPLLLDLLTWVSLNINQNSLKYKYSL